MPEIGLDALAAIGSTALDIGGEAAGAIGAGLGGLASAGGGIFDAATGLISGFANAAETGLGELAGIGGAAGDPLAGLIGGTPGLAEGAGGLESSLMAFNPDISSLPMIDSAGGFFPGTAAQTGIPTDLNTLGFTSFGQEAFTGAPGLGGGGGMTELASLGGGTDLLGAGGGAAGGAGELATTGGAGGGGLLDSLTGSFTKNPLGIAAAGAGLGYNILQGQKLSGNQQALTNAANAQAGQGAMLQQYIQTGQLPPGLQAMVDNATKAAKAQMISSYAAKGLNADPNGNAQLAQDLASIDMKAAEAGGQMALNLLQQGINETGMSNQLYQFLVGVDQKQSQLMGQAITNFSTALAGGPKTIQIGTGAVA